MKRWLVNMSARFSHFMRFRNGQDQLNNFLAVVYLILVITRGFIRNETAYLVVTFFVFFLLIVIIYRFFSKNKIQRSRENSFYLKYKYRLRNLFNRNVRKVQNRTEYKYFDCPNCHQTLRVPRGKGKVDVTCPKCHTKFEKRT